MNNGVSKEKVIKFSPNVRVRNVLNSSRESDDVPSTSGISPNHENSRHLNIPTVRRKKPTIIADQLLTTPQASAVASQPALNKINDAKKKPIIFRIRLPIDSTNPQQSNSSNPSTREEQHKKKGKASISVPEKPLIRKGMILKHEQALDKIIKIPSKSSPLRDQDNPPSSILRKPRINQVVNDVLNQPSTSSRYMGTAYYNEGNLLNSDSDDDEEDPRLIVQPVDAIPPNQLLEDDDVEIVESSIDDERLEPERSQPLPLFPTVVEPGAIHDSPSGANEMGEHAPVNRLEDSSNQNNIERDEIEVYYHHVVTSLYSSQRSITDKDKRRAFDLTQEARAIEKLLYKVEDLEKRLRRAEELLYYVFSGNNSLEEPCPMNYTKISKECYYISSRGYDWKSSSSLCRGVGGNLIEFETSEEYRNVRNFLQNIKGIKGYDFWTGGLNPGLLWIWASSAKPVYKNQTETVDGYGRCLKIRTSSQESYTFSGEECTKKLRYICQLAQDEYMTESGKIDRGLEMKRKTLH